MAHSTTADKSTPANHGGHDAINPGDIAVGVIIGRTSEFFDFFVYAIASVIVFPKLVFPQFDPLLGTIYSFGIFALAFVARPIGTVIFMAVDRSFGRHAKLTIALFTLGTSTAGMAFLPGYADIGVASAWLLALARFAQGIALGGTWDGLPSLLNLNAPPNQRGWYAMIPQLGAPIGLMVASALFAFFVVNLSAADFFDWGWRYPFFVAFAINVVALFARLRLVVTQEYTKLMEEHELEPVGVIDLVRAQGNNLFLGAFAALANFVRKVASPSSKLPSHSRTCGSMCRPLAWARWSRWLPPARKSWPSKPRKRFSSTSRK